MDDDTAAILINNPSNPCGSVFSVKHIREIIAVAEKNKVPVIADEIYAHFVSTLRQRRGNETNVGGAVSHDDGFSTTPSPLSGLDPGRCGSDAV